MRLSICIPTHDGRAAKLQRALDSILDQVDIDLHGVVEVCVSDNASEDGTAVLVAERQRERPKLLRYHAFSHTQGFAPNLLQAVALASGEFCWLFSSDDLMAPGGLRRVLRLLERNPDATGATVRPSPFDFEALRPGPPFYPQLMPPEPEREHRWTTVHETVTKCGAMMGLLPAQIVRRELWREAVDELGKEGLAQVPVFPHLAVIYRMVLRRSVWLWDPGPAFLLRTDAPNSAADEVEGHLARYHIKVTEELVSIWCGLFGRGPLLRTLLRTALRTHFHPAAIAAYKRQRGQTLADDALLLKRSVAWFWPFHDFWSRSFPMLLLPHQAVPTIAALVRKVRAG